jgi:hypothetical protein
VTSRVYRCVVQQELVVIVDRAADLTVRPGLMQARQEGTTHVSRLDPLALMGEAVSEADCGNAIDVVAGDATVSDFEELTP